MLKMSFQNGTLDKEKLKEFIENYEKPIKYTYGLQYRNPRINNEVIAKEHALDIAESETMLDVKEYKNYLHLNAYSANDLF